MSKADSPRPSSTAHSWGGETARNSSEKGRKTKCLARKEATQRMDGAAILLGAA